MMDVVHIIIAIGVLLVVGGIGFAAGVGVGRAAAKKWLADNCCYLCREKWRYKTGDLMEDE